LLNTIEALFAAHPFNLSLLGPIQEAMVGSPQIIQCAVSGVESGLVMIKWMGPGRDITSNGRVTFNDSGFMSSLNFVYLMEGDKGHVM